MDVLDTLAAIAAIAAIATIAAFTLELYEFASRRRRRLKTTAKGREAGGEPGLKDTKRRPLSS